MRFQQTLAKTVSLSGQGLHSGKPTQLVVHPAPADTGLVFCQSTSGQVQYCPASIRNLHQTDLCTALYLDGFQIQTIEHLMAALSGLEIDNAYLELNGHEVPAMDGSAAPFASLILQAGIIEHEIPRTYLKIVHPISVGNPDRSLSVFPSALPKITYTIEYEHPLIESQTYAHLCSPSEFERNIAQARTFAFKNEVEWLWSRGLGIGGSLDNTLVFSDVGLMNEDGLRFQDECVRHKILDLIGDLTLLGFPVIGNFIADRAGHQLHAELVRAILDNPDSWILINAAEDVKETLPAILASNNPTPVPQSQPAFSS